MSTWQQQIKQCIIETPCLNRHTMLKDYNVTKGYDPDKHHICFACDGNIAQGKVVVCDESHQIQCPQSCNIVWHYHCYQYVVICNFCL